jgi:hypothetical protein
VTSVLRGGFDRMIVDPEFVADLGRTSLDLDPLPGAQLQNIVAQSVQVSDAVRQRARDIFAR